MLRCIWAIWVVSTIDGIIECRANMIKSGENDPYDQYSEFNSLFNLALFSRFNRRYIIGNAVATQCVMMHKF
jgi:hypothetical protein